MLEDEKKRYIDWIIETLNRSEILAVELIPQYTEYSDPESNIYIPIDTKIREIRICYLEK